MRKNSLLLYVVAAGLCACGGNKGYTIQGPAEGDYAVLNIWNPGNETVRDTVAIENGRFLFKGSVDDVFMGEVLVFADGEKPLRHVLIVENSPLELKDGKFTGGPNNDFMRAMDAVSAGLDHEAPDFSEKLKEGMNACFAAHPDVEAAAFYYYIFNRETPLPEYEAGFEKFTPRVQASLMGKNAREEIRARKATLQGIPAPTFTLEGLDGTSIALESLQGKYVLLDFWASWCKPCRESMPWLKSLYSQYKDKGFEILSISTDSKADDWKQAVTDDQTPWIHVIDNKEAGVAGTYGVHAVPTFFLIDPEGVIVGKPDHGSLAGELARLLE